MEILVADDDAGVSALLQSMLKGFGYHPTIVTNGTEAIRAVRGNRFDLAILDINMPDLDGIGAARILSRESKVPLIFCSGVCNASTVLSATQLGALGFLVKPFTRDQLYATVHLAIAQNRRLNAAFEKSQGLNVLIEEMQVITLAVDLMVERFLISHQEADERLRGSAEKTGRTVLSAAQSIIATLRTPPNNPAVTGN